MKTKISAAVLMALVSSTAQSAVIISEYIEGSSNNKAIELYNNGDTTVDLSGYQLKYFFNGKTTASTTITLEGEIAPTQTYVISENDAVTAILDVAQLTNNNSWYNGDDAIVLYQGETVVDSIGQVGVDPGSYWADGDIRTQNRTLRRLASVTVGDTDPTDAYTPNEFEVFAQDTFDGLGSHLGQSGGDNGGEDGGGDNGGEPPAPILVCGESFTAISAVQGDGETSPFAGQEVIVEGVVTLDVQESDQLKGFYLQSVTADNNPLTSEAVFVYDSNFAVNQGDVVQLRAEVAEYYGGTQLGNVADLVICGTGSVAATPISFPVADDTALEAYEHMLVKVDQPMVVTDNYGLVRYGQFTIASERLYQGTQVAAPGDAANAVEQANSLKSIVVDDGSTQQNADSVPYPGPELSAYNSLRLGDSVDYVEGVMTYSYSAYRIHPTQNVNIVSTNPRTDTPATLDTGHLTVGSFNVLNYFNGDGQGAGFPTPRGADSAEEFERQRAKTIAAIAALDADVLGLLEVENDGFDEFSALQDLVTGVSEATGSNYQFVSLGVDNVGTDAITSAIIYNADNVTLTGTPAFTAAVPFDYGNRAPIAASFAEKETGEVFTMVVTHFRSKGSCRSATGLDQDQGDGQGCWNATRVEAVNSLNAWLATNPTGVEDSDVIILGDMNAYTKEDPIAQFEALGYQNTIADPSKYSYMYFGRLGSLDHAFVSSSMADKMINATHWNINADEPAGLDYNLEYKSEYQQSNLYDAGPFRASDHDPIVLEFEFEKVTEKVFTDLSGRFFRGQRFWVEIPEGTKSFEVTLEGGEGNANLYVGNRMRPWTWKEQCLSRNPGNDESCRFDSPRAGKWLISVRGMRHFSDATLTYRIVE